MLKRFNKFIIRLPWLAQALYSIIYTVVIIIIIVCPGLLIQPFTGKVSNAEIELARENYEKGKEFIDLDNVLIDAYFYTLIDAGEILWYSSVMELVNSAVGMINTAEDTSRLLVKASDKKRAVEERVSER